MPLETSTKKRLSLAVYYLLAGLSVGWPGLLALGRALPAWQQGVTASSWSLAAIHLLILGSMLTVAFGVLYQIIPIAFQAPPIPRHVLYWHLPVHLSSVALMVIGFLQFQFDLVGLGGTLLLGSSVAFISIVARSYLRARNKTPVHKALALPATVLFVVFLLGIFQAFFPGHASQSIILTHVLLGGFAFWGGLILVFSYKLVPMFVISHGYKVSLRRTGATYFSGVLLLMLSNWFASSAIGRVICDAGCSLWLVALVLYAVDMVAIVRARKKRRIVLPMYNAFLAMLFLIIGQVGVILALFLRVQSWLYPSVYLFGFGGIMSLMFAYMQKIVPFLWFEYRFSKRPERKTAPLIDDMVPKKMAQGGMALYFFGVGIGLLGFFAGRGGGWQVGTDWGSAIVMTLGSMLLFRALQSVLTIGGTRPQDEP